MEWRADGGCNHSAPSYLSSATRAQDGADFRGTRDVADDHGHLRSSVSIGGTFEAMDAIAKGLFT